MSSIIRIAVDAMGGENSPKKVIHGILDNYKKNKDIIYNIFGDKYNIEKHLPNNYNKEIFKIFDTKNKILDFNRFMNQLNFFLNKNLINSDKLPKRI